MNVTAHLASGAIVRRTTAAMTVAASVFGFAAVAAWAQTGAEAEPPSIEKVIVGDKGAANIEGEGRPGDVVLLMSSGTAIGEAPVAQNGRWRVALKDGLKPGTHQIRAEARSASAGSVAPGDEIRIAIPEHAGGQAVVAYDGVTGDRDRTTRQRAEDLAEAAGQAYDDVTVGAKSRDVGSPPRAADADAAAPPDAGPVTVVIEWLKRAARGYREEVAGKLGVPVPAAAPADLDATAAARTITKERAEAEARRIDLAEADTVRKAQEAQKAEADTQKLEAVKRRKADDLARRKAEADRRIAEDLARLKDAKEAADRAKAAPAAPKQKANITLERFYLPGQRKPAATEQPAGGERVALAKDLDEAAAEPAARSTRSGRCAEGRVIKRKGRRWYVTGADDTLWDIAERFYGSGTDYPRIYKVNRKRLSNPHIVRPCLALRLPGRRG